MSKDTKKILGFIAFGVVLYAMLMNLSAAVGLLKGFVGLIMPVLIGLIIAFVINVPMTGFQKLFAKIPGKRHNKPHDKFLHKEAFSVIHTALCILKIPAMDIPAPDT